MFTSPAVTMSGRTSVGVAPPRLVLGATNTDNNVVTVTVTPLSTFGPHSYYQVIVSSVPLTNTATTIATSDLLPFSEATNGYYVTWFATSNNADTARIIMIGTGAPTSTINRDTTYINQALQPGQYYVFVRLYNDTRGYGDSVVVTINIPTPLPVAAVIVPIALLAIILLVVLVALLIFAVWRLQGPPRRRAYIPGEKGMSDGKGRRSNNIELRRTRLFAPMLNVGSPDVFTSAGQPTTLMCEASGTPAPDVTWTRDGEPLDKERFIQLADSSLFVNDTDLQDEGEYVVTAINSAGQAEQLVKVTVLRPVPPEPDADHPPVKAGDFTEKLALLRANDDEALEDEYSEIELDWTFTSYAAKLNINKNKNRYINIIPYDHSRVVLSLQDSTPGSDYINGSYVDGYNHSNEYIATQGPIPSTFPDFWRMVWEMDSPTIVMVTNLKEEDKVKCHQYWPSYGTTTYGNIQVTLKEVENLAEYSIRTFTVTPLAGQSRAQMPVREVRQFHFLVWPDHGVPVYATALLTFRKRVLRYHPAKRGPMVVHCSAGVGRTGTFITIDVCLNQVEGESNLDIFNYVRHMRFRRNYMVQTASQYVFIHDAVLESIMCGDNSIPAPELKSKLQSLVEVNADTGKSTFELQFETLNSTSPADDEFDCSVAQLPDNAAKNRFKEHLPSNDCRVVLSSEDDQCDYICASALDGYRHRNNFIVTQAPLTETVGDFWRMVWEQKSAAIIMLTQLEEDGQEMSVKYWPGTTGEAGVFGGYQLELSEDEKNKGDYITRRFKLSPVDNPQESRMVTQFHFTCWSKKTPPEGTHSILDLIDELQRVQRKSGNGPITVHCDNGLGRSGAFCTLYTVLERVKAEQVVDVFQAIKTLRIQRVGLMESLDEYIFVHKAVVEFLESFSDYQNFK
ncbi:receptor-type tyrosine-protein phosphatase F-like [Halichondria panicea]|uniref:receptor-type tyrosine-protein phosphatase F-like n=1 Tax=Halichondria panicea TaxID=6063 RepID=UPI00312BA747